MGKETKVTPPVVTPPAEVIIKGTVRSNPEQGRNGYQQTIKVEGESLIALKALIAQRRAKGEFGNSPTILWGSEERGFFVYVPVSTDIVANLKGSGRQVDNTVTISIADRNGWCRVMASVSADIKAKNEAKKAANLAEEAAKLTEMKATVNLFSKLGLNKQIVALQLLSEKTNGMDVAAVFTALQGDAPAPVSRSSRLTEANKETVSNKKSLGGNDDEDLDGTND